MRCLLLTAVSAISTGLAAPTLAGDTASSPTPTDPAYLAVLAATVMVLTGDLAMPLLLLLARPLQPIAGRLAIAAAWAGVKATLAKALRWAVAILTAGAALSLVLAFAISDLVAAQSAPPKAVSGTASVGAMIETLAASIKKAKKPLPAWAADLAMRALDIYLTYSNGKRVGAVEKRVEEVEQEVLAILLIVTDVRARVEADHQMSDREFRLTRELLDVHSRRLDELTGRVARLEQTAAEQAKQLTAYRALTDKLRRQLGAARGEVGDLTLRVRRPGCGLGRAYRRGACVDVAANPR